MDRIALVVVALVFFAIVLIAQAYFFYTKGQRETEDTRLRRRLGLEVGPEDGDDVASLVREQAADTMLDSLGNIGESMQFALQAAGSEKSVSSLVMQMLAIGGVITVLLMPLVGIKGIFVGIGFGYIPYASVKSKATKRAKLLLEQVPDSLELMGRAMQAGTGLSECFKLVQEEMKDPIAGAFGRVYEEIRLGRDWRYALESLVARYPTVFELRLFVSSMLLQRETGGNMIETVNRLSKLIRQRYVFDAKVRAMTSEARASGFILAAMPIGVVALVLLANAAYLEPLVTTPTGQTVIVYCSASYALGIFMMKKSSRVEI